jgi:hypothetical protein
MHSDLQKRVETIETQLRALMSARTREEVEKVHVPDAVSPTNNTAPKDPIERAVERYNMRAQEVATPLRQFQTPSGYQNKDTILARLNRVEQMIDGATIGATCDATTSTITVTLNWGA